MDSNYTIALARAYTKWRSYYGGAVHTTPGVFHAAALQHLAAYGAAGIASFMEGARAAESAAWQRVEWGERPEMTRAQAEAAGRARCEREARWLWPITGDDVLPGPATGLAPRNVVDTSPTSRQMDPADHTTEAPYTKPKGSRQAARIISSDDDLLRAARDVVRSSGAGLEGTAFHAKVHETFKVMRTAQRAAPPAPKASTAPLPIAKPAGPPPRPTVTRKPIASMTENEMHGELAHASRDDWSAAISALRGRLGVATTAMIPPEHLTLAGKLRALRTYRGEEV